MHELMDPSIVQHQMQQQEMSSHSLETMLQANCSSAAGKPTNSGGGAAAGDQRKPRPQPEHALKCPRCDSTNTKFCYYNNYSLSQPRYFCKSCRRYWTKGGTLRNVPVGGGCRKNKRSSSSNSSSATSSATSTPSSSSSLLMTHLLPPSSISSSAAYDSNDLALAFARLQKHHHQLGFDHDQMFNAGNNFLLHNSFLDSGSNLQGLYYGGGGGGYDGNSTFEQQNHEMSVMSDHYTSGDQPDNEPVSGPATTQAVTVTTMKQEYLLNHGRQEESGGGGGNKVLWGFPWQMNGGCDNGGNVVVDNNNNTMRMSESGGGGGWWSSGNGGSNGGGGGVIGVGGGGSSGAANWHGLLNTTPLM
ncbi:unnamed protein product [Linum trigynum]|uniref:Dof zinc finger protein n=1 Tax=Linum trigynum TaxID=586398 RepID=A0AAV2FZC6_9ROSI